MHVRGKHSDIVAARDKFLANIIGSPAAPAPDGWEFIDDRKDAHVKIYSKNGLVQDDGLERGTNICMFAKVSDSSGLYSHNSGTPT